MHLKQTLKDFYDEILDCIKSTYFIFNLRSFSFAKVSCCFWVSLSNYQTFWICQPDHHIFQWTCHSQFCVKFGKQRVKYPVSINLEIDIHDHVRNFGHFSASWKAWIWKIPNDKTLLLKKGFWWWRLGAGISG